MIETQNLRLVPCELAHFDAILNDSTLLQRMLGVTLAERWLEFPEAMQFGYEYLRTSPEALGWWTYLFIHAKDRALIGSGGFVGLPDESGKVEIGYSIAPAYRNRGLATEAAQGFVTYAFSKPQVKMVDAHTLIETNPSSRVLEKIGMTKIGTTHDPDEGEVWHWRLTRDGYERTLAHSGSVTRVQT